MSSDERKPDEREIVILPPLPDDDPELRDYHLEHLMQFYEDFLRITRSRPKSRKKDVAREKDVARQEDQPGTGNQEPGTENEPGSSNPEPEVAARRRRRATKQILRVRLAAVREWLIEGRDVHAVIHKVREEFRVGRRMAQLYIQRVKKRLAHEAASEDYLAHLQLSRGQHEKLLAKAMHAIEVHGGDPKVLNALLRTAGQYLKRRDEVVSVIVEHRTAVKRDRSPDQEQEKLKRQRKIEMPIDEWWERLSNIYYTWRLHWEKLQNLKADAEMYRREGREDQIPRFRAGWETQRQMHAYLEQGKRTVDPDVLKELELDGVEIPPLEPPV